MKGKERQKKNEWLVPRTALNRFLDQQCWIYETAGVIWINTNVFAYVGAVSAEV